MLPVDQSGTLKGEFGFVVADGHFHLPAASVSVNDLPGLLQVVDRLGRLVSNGYYPVLFLRMPHRKHSLKNDGRIAPVIMILVYHFAGHLYGLYSFNASKACWRSALVNSSL